MTVGTKKSGMAQRRYHSKNLGWRTGSNSSSSSDDTAGARTYPVHRRVQSKNMLAMMSAYGPEEELPAKSFDDEEISTLVREYIKIGDETDKEAILIALKVCFFFCLSGKILSWVLCIAFCYCVFFFAFFFFWSLEKVMSLALVALTFICVIAEKRTKNLRDVTKVISAVEFF